MECSFCATGAESGAHEPDRVHRAGTGRVQQQTAEHEHRQSGAEHGEKRVQPSHATGVSKPRSRSVARVAGAAKLPSLAARNEARSWSDLTMLPSDLT